MLRPHYEKYREASAAVMTIFRVVTPIVEPLSIDEAFLDVAGAVKLFGPPAADRRRAAARGCTARPASPAPSAPAPSKFIAKLASTRSKPDGLLVVPPDRALDFLHPLPIGALWGVGPATRDALQRRGIRHVAGPRRHLAEVLLEAGSARPPGAKLHDLAWGRDPRQVSTQPGREEHRAREHVRPRTSATRSSCAASCSSRPTGSRCGCAAAGYRARTISLKLRFADFTTVSRSRTLAEPTDLARRIHEETAALLDAPSGCAAAPCGCSAPAASS